MGMNGINWDEVVSRLAELESAYAAIGTPGAFVREHVLRPLRDRWNQGERTAELAREIYEVSL